jgi:hypothetical protein
MGIIQFLLLLAFVLIYVVIAGGLIVRFAARGGYFMRNNKQESELPLQG